MGTASGHAAAACAPDDPYGGHCRVLVAEVKDNYPHEMTVFCRVFGISSCSRGVEKATRVAHTYWVGDNCSWPPPRPHRSGRATREPRTRWLQRRPLFDSFQVVVLLVGGFNRLSGESWAAHIDDAGHVDTGAVSRAGKSTSFNLLWSSVFLRISPYFQLSIVRRCPQSAVFLQKWSSRRCTRRFHLHSTGDVYPLTQNLGRGTSRSLASDSPGTRFANIPASANGQKPRAMLKAQAPRPPKPRRPDPLPRQITSKLFPAKLFVLEGLVSN